MERFVEAALTCDDVRGAIAVSELFSFLSEGRHEETALAEYLSARSIPGGSGEAVIALHAGCQESLSGLETHRIEGETVRFSFVCGWDAEAFLQALARYAIDGSLAIERLVATGDESVVVCEVVGGRVCLEEFDDFAEYERVGLSDSQGKLREAATVAGPTPSVPILLGRWELEIETTLELFREKMVAEWDEMPELVRRMFSPLEGYIGTLRAAYSDGGPKILEFDEKEIVTLYGTQVHSRSPYRVSEARGLSIDIIEYYEDMGEVEELPKSLRLEEDPLRMVMRYSRKVEAYKKL